MEDPRMTPSARLLWASGHTKEDAKRRAQKVATNTFWPGNLSWPPDPNPPADDFKEDIWPEKTGLTYVSGTKPDVKFIDYLSGLYVWGCMHSDPDVVREHMRWIVKSIVDAAPLVLVRRWPYMERGYDEGRSAWAWAATLRATLVPMPLELPANAWIKAEAQPIRWIP